MGNSRLDEKVFPSAGDPRFADYLAEVQRPLVFTNGCFDILHRGHVSYLETAASLGKGLIVGVNSDESVRRLGKDPDRPFNNVEDRMAVLAALQSVDAVVAFDEDTPLELILVVRPDVLVKGGDWAVPDIVGGTEVQSWGGSVHSIEFEFQRSTTALIDKIRNDT